MTFFCKLLKGLLHFYTEKAQKFHLLHHFALNFNRSEKPLPLCEEPLTTTSKNISNFNQINTHSDPHLLSQEHHNNYQ